MRNPNVIRVKKKQMEKALDTGRVLCMNTANLLFNGSKALYLGGGWWRIIGYHAEPRRETIAKIKKTIIKK